MSDYRNGKKTGSIPQPGRHIDKVIERRIEVVQKEEPPVNELNVDAIAKAVIDALSKTNIEVGRNSNEASKQKIKNDFDPSKSLSKLADAMTVQRGNSSSNFEDLGTVKKTETNKDAVDKTIDLLSNLDEDEGE